MKISDRDKKLILFVLLAAIIALPIVFYIKPKKENIDSNTQRLADLEVRFQELKALDEKRPDYEAAIENYAKERTEMIANYATGILQENTIMFLRGIEISEHPIYMTLLQFGEIEETPVTTDSVDEEGNLVEGLTAKKYVTTVNFHGSYEDIKYFLDYIFNNEDKMLIQSINMKVNQKNNRLEGTFVLEQYAVTGEGRSLDSVKVDGIIKGEDYIFFQYYDEEGNLLTEEDPDEEAEDDNEVAETGK